MLLQQLRAHASVGSLEPVIALFAKNFTRH